MLNQSDLIQLYQAVEKQELADNPLPIVGPIVASFSGQTRIYRVPAVVGTTDQTITVTSWPITASNDFPGSLVGEPIVVGSPRFFDTVWLQEAEDAAQAVSSTTPTVTAA